MDFLEKDDDKQGEDEDHFDNPWIVWTYQSFLRKQISGGKLTSLHFIPAVFCKEAFIL